MKPFAALILAPAVALVPAIGRYERTESRHEALTSGSNLSVRTANGAIKVTVWDKEELDLQADIKEREKDSVKIVTRRNGNTLEIEAQFPSQASWGESDSASFTLKVPHRLAGRFTTSNGRIEMSGLEGTQEATTSNARIQVEDVKGDLTAHTSNGSVSVARLQGNAKGATSNGAVQLERISGGVEFSTSNGSIKARDLDGQGQGIRLTTSNGAIVLELGKAAGDIDAATSNGSVKVERQGVELIETKGHRARLKVPGSQQEIRLRTSNGSITIQ